MISSLHRFHGHNSLRNVYKHGKTVRTPNLSLKYTKRPAKPYRIAVVVSKKVHKSAVTRNRIRRRLYEICRKQQDINMDGYDLVFTVFSDQLAKIEAAKLEKTVAELLKKAITTSVGHDIVKADKTGK